MKIFLVIFSDWFSFEWFLELSGCGLSDRFRSSLTRTRFCCVERSTEFKRAQLKRGKHIKYDSYYPLKARGHPKYKARVYISWFGGILKRLILYFWSINLWIQEITIPIMDMGHLDINMGIWIGIIMTHNGYIPWSDKNVLNY